MRFPQIYGQIPLLSIFILQDFYGSLEYESLKGMEGKAAHSKNWFNYCFHKLHVVDLYKKQQVQ